MSAHLSHLCLCCAGAFSILPCKRDGADLFTTDDRLKVLTFTGSPVVRAPGHALDPDTLHHLPRCAPWHPAAAGCGCAIRCCSVRPTLPAWCCQNGLFSILLRVTMVWCTRGQEGPSGAL